MKVAPKNKKKLNKKQDKQFNLSQFKGAKSAAAPLVQKKIAANKRGASFIPKGK
jgi:hypothetical protein